MRIELKNLGILKQAEFSLGDMTIICGTNNTGKTYATYALFGFLARWERFLSIDIAPNIIKTLLAEGSANIDLTQYVNDAETIISKGCLKYKEQLPMVFAAQEGRFAETEFRLTVDPGALNPEREYEQRISAFDAEYFSVTKTKGSRELTVTLLVKKEKVKIPTHVISRIISDSLCDVIFGHLFPRTFIASAERTGAAIFSKELNFQRNRMLEEISQAAQKIDPFDLLAKVYTDYALPVKTNVDFIRQLGTIARKKSEIALKYPGVIQDFAGIIGGEYGVHKNTDELYYVSSKSKRVKLSMDESSSAVRSLLDVGFYLHHVARPGDLLMVDEPELNLHPENQRRVARLFARLVNLGIKIYITTHSDYIIKELNTLIMLNQDKPHLAKIMDKEGYQKEELLSHDKIKVYIAQEKPLPPPPGGTRKSKIRGMTLTPADIDPGLGIEVGSFDKTINEMNDIQDAIFWGAD